MDLEMQNSKNLFDVETNDKTFDDIITQKFETLKPVLESGNLVILSQQKITHDGNVAYVTNAEGLFSSGNDTFNVKFKELLVMTPKNSTL